MRRDVFRAGLGRLCFELALGATLLLSDARLERGIVVAIVVVAQLSVFAAFARWPTTRGAFYAAHAAMFCAALGAWIPVARLPLLALGLSVAIELTHVDVALRRRIHESLATLRWPRSVVLRRIGSVILWAAGARAWQALEILVPIQVPYAVLGTLVVMGAMAALSAGFSAGPGRPRTLPLDALAYVGGAALLTLGTSR